MLPPRRVGTCVRPARVLAAGGGTLRASLRSGEQGPSRANVLDNPFDFDEVPKLPRSRLRASQDSVSRIQRGIDFLVEDQNERLRGRFPATVKPKG